MNGCRHQRFHEMLWAYELGMLDETDRDALEVHIIECDYCRRDLLEFSTIAQRIRHDVNIHETIERVATEKRQSTATGEVEAEITTPLWRRYLPMTAVAAAVMLILLLTDWQVEIRPKQEAVATQNRLAIMYFENLTADAEAPRLGEIATNLLMADLSESHYIQIVSGQRLYDLLKSVGKEGVKIISRDVATQIAHSANAKFMLTGTILQVNPQLEIATQLIDISSGDVIGAPRISGEPGETVFSLVDKLTVKIKRELSLPPAALTEPDQRVTEITSQSAEAYWHYLEGVDYFRKFYNDEAAASMLRAVKYDSTLAMAYYYLAGLTDQRWMAQAMQYLDRAGEREQFLIRSRHHVIRGEEGSARGELKRLLERYPDEKDALFQLAALSLQGLRYAVALESLQRLLRIDTTYANGYNLLAYVYSCLGDFENALRAANTYMALAPDEPNPYDSRGDIYANHGRLELAIDSYKQAIQIRPRFAAASMKLGTMYIFAKEYDTARTYLKEFISVCEQPYCPFGRLYLACIPIHQGKLDSALELLDYGIGADRLELDKPTLSTANAHKYLLKARIQTENNRPVLALKEFEEFLDRFQQENPDGPAVYQKSYGELLVDAGDYTRAKEIAADLQRGIDTCFANRWRYLSLSGYLELAQGNPETAISYLQQAEEITTEFDVKFSLGQAQFQAGRFTEAIESFETLLNSFTEKRVYEGIRSVKLHYYLALALEEAGRRDDAMDQYEIFLDIWRNADEGISAIDDARERLARLKANG